MSATLRLESVSVSAGGALILDGVSLEVAPGAIVAIVGPNGAGKTTLLDAVSGVLPGMSGRVVLVGQENGHRPGGPRPGVGRVFQGSPLPATLTIGEVAELAAGSRKAARGLLRRFGLLPHATKFVAELSTGMRRILDLAVATAGSPTVLLLDEPASGLAQAEIEQLAAVLKKWRDTTGAAVLIVEHDAWLVQAVADEVVVMDGGRVVAQGTSEKVLRARVRARPRVRSPQDPRFAGALARVAAEGVEAPGIVKRSVSTWTLLRLGLREFAAGLGSVLILGVLNRVMKVELGISLGIVAAVLASYNLAAPFALAIGHRSDTRPIFGRRRLPYIMAGAVVTGLTVMAAPHVAGQLAKGISPLSVLGAVALFVAMGVGMYGAGAVFFALLSDVAPPEDRGHAASIVYLELLAGIFVGVGLVGSLVDDQANGLPTLFAVAGVLIIGLTALAVWGHEDRLAGTAQPEPAPEISFRQAVRGIAAMSQARLFFVFMIASTLFLFLQQAVLEPYGGDVLGLTVRQTSAFNAVMTVGTIAGMLVAGRPFAAKLGHRTVATAGLAISVLAFAGLAAAAATGAAPATWLAILGVGLGTGAFNVATLALMMGMAGRGRAALFMGLWTMAHAVADGGATAGGGGVFEIVRAVVGTEAGGYAAVFALEAVGLALCIPLLRAIDQARFQREAAAFDPAAQAPHAAALDEVPITTPDRDASPSSAIADPSRTSSRGGARGGGGQQRRAAGAGATSGKTRRRSARATRA